MHAIANLHRYRRYVRSAVLLLAAAVVTAPLAWWVAVHVGSFPRERLEPWHAASLTVLDAQGNVLRQDATAAGGRETWVPLDAIAVHLRNATIASEDRRFWTHAGVDPVGILRAGWLDLARGRAAFGGSTLTMQLARQLDPHPRSLRGKIYEAVVAGRIERVLSKREIFEQYLNRVYYGNGAWGAEAAARFYFGKPAGALSLGEAAFLAVLPRGPAAYDPFQHFDAAIARRRHILGLMQDAGLITAAARDVAERTPLVFRREHPELRALHFVEHVLAQLRPDERAGATIETTLDGPLQQRLEIAVRDHLEAVGGRGISQAGVVVIRNRDGAVLAMVGSRDYFDARHAGAVNVTTIRRRPGSTLKPFVYGLALEAGDSPATLAYDVVLPGETRETYTAEVKQHGAARYRESLAGSYNLAAVHTLARVGPPALVERLRLAGLTTLTDPDEKYPLSLAIGEAEFRIIEYAGAFAAFGNGGRAVQPRAIARVAIAGRTARVPALAQPTTIFRPEIAYLIFDILSDPDARRPMFGSSAPMILDFPVALKTGTTRAYTDDLAFGTTAEYTVGAWGGNFDGSPTAGVMAMQGAAPLVRAAFVSLAARFGSPTAPVRPPSLERGEVCALSGMLPGPDCPHKHEIFAAGTRPRELCTWHRRACGRPEVKFPAEVEGWARVHGLVHPRPFDCPDESGQGGAGATLAITYPADGARFLLDPERAPAQQRPPLRAIPARAPVRWTVDGATADRFVPSPGEHRVTASLGGVERAITIWFE
ncbi:MAG TPA: transglycosylase domain-containing protein [Polyangia bacterium]|jgi:penicillin-binding protein 1C|nr:transglycosylase domain-containing protein [Polyangia bacterium]